MKTLYDDWDTWQRLMSMLEYQFGSNCEIILHDLTKDYNHEKDIYKIHILQCAVLGLISTFLHLGGIQPGRIYQRGFGYFHRWI